MKNRLVLLCVVLPMCSHGLMADESHQHFEREQLGTVVFPISCAPAIQRPFERAVALMHSFWYDEAEKQC